MHIENKNIEALRLNIVKGGPDEDGICKSYGSLSDLYTYSRPQSTAPANAR
jgi:hypothetical protein